MLHKKSQQNLLVSLLIFALVFGFLQSKATAQELLPTLPNNFGQPGIIDLPTAKRLPNGELVITQQVHKMLTMTGLTFQALPRVGLTFRYGGQGRGGGYAQGRVNWDRSFDAHISVLDEGPHLPSISIGLRDFIGTGWYSSEYIVASKSIGNLQLTTGLGYGRLAGKNAFPNPLRVFSSRFENRQSTRRAGDRGGTLGNINWFQGDAAAFYGFSYRLGEKVTLLSEYSPDLMLRENSYLDVKSPWNFGVSYRLNDYINISTQYLYGDQVSVTTSIITNPGRPPFLGGKELAPVPMRLRGSGTLAAKKNNEEIIRKVLAADHFKIYFIDFNVSEVDIGVTNTKFRSTAQALGRLTSTLQRFTSDDVKVATISFIDDNLKTATYRVDLDKVTKDQFDPQIKVSDGFPITAIDATPFELKESEKKFTWGFGPYIAHRLFNPDLPLSMEVGAEIKASYQIIPGVKLASSLRKSILTNLTKNKRGSKIPYALPRVNSDWRFYDLEGQSGHIHDLTLSYETNLAPGLYGRAQAGLLSLSLLDLVEKFFISLQDGLLA